MPRPSGGCFIHEPAEDNRGLLDQRRINKCQRRSSRILWRVSGCSGGRRALHVKMARDDCRVSLASCKGRHHWDFLMRKATIGGRTNSAPAFERCFKTRKLREWKICTKVEKDQCLRRVG